MGAGVMKKHGGAGRRRRGGRGKHSVMAEINVTPMVDVMLVLLIIFMVAAPMMTVGVPLELPKTAAKAVPTEQEEPLAVSLQLDGTVSLMNSDVPEEELVDRLRAIAAERDSTKVYLRADGGIDYARVVQVMGALNAGGFNDIILVTDPGGPSLTGNAAAGN
ncbi:cell division and transport-associated protein TolR [Rhodobacter aestuarii]|uniref:Cell division and transport-associated protein TolR n=1 Tax=Rhodobacter aestuarii TaxID=453582 RepID=A0A1N7Q5M6_9RHOB|nr:MULTISPECIES: ExbD/TolR family protein [Rhodobacter]PTV93872.1 cell division and transport-associated protein TolR [Rhodobacter aestuarii]SIT18168.1 Cell division and transport-associated protein TolR [Rhodobacter aestuarii]SOC15669.1 cell division and transport-associated protein TolR [Rhodobacter sp. JA431]